MERSLTLDYVGLKTLKYITPVDSLRSNYRWLENVGESMGWPGNVMVYATVRGHFEIGYLQLSRKV